jgi:hypothetical protein
MMDKKQDASKFAVRVKKEEGLIQGLILIRGRTPYIAADVQTFRVNSKFPNDLSLARHL